MYRVFFYLLFFSLFAPPGNIVGAPSSLRTIAVDSTRELNLPPRPDNAKTGSEIARQISGLSLSERERAVVREILAGNVPSFARKLRGVTFSQSLKSVSHEITFYTVCDYLAIGSDQDYLYIPMTPSTAQYLADRLDSSLPTKKLVDIIYSSAEIKLRPQPIPPSDKMTTVPVFLQHTDSIKQQIADAGFDRSADNIIAGHKKDIIISNKIYSPDRNYDRVVIYGWHRGVNRPIQPVYNGHSGEYADYSHGVRLILNTVVIDGDSLQLDQVVQDRESAPLLSSEGVIQKPYYPASTLFTAVDASISRPAGDFNLLQNYPNPFNPVTTIRYRLAQTETVELSIFSLTGQKVATLFSGTQPAGDYRVEWHAPGAASGLYIYTLRAGDRVKSRRMIFAK